MSATPRTDAEVKAHNCARIDFARELERDNAKLRELVERIAKQRASKPDYWSTCGQCEQNTDDAKDALGQS